MARPISILLLLVAACPAFAQRIVDDPPIVGRPVDFSNIVGKYAIQVSAEPLKVVLEEPITLTVRVTGTGPAKYQPQRKNLQIFPNWDDDYFVENVPEEDRAVKAENAWTFVYRLRPKHTKVDAIDDIKLCYWDPASRKFEHRYAPRVANIQVKPRPDAAEKIVVSVTLPESFYQVASPESVLEKAQAPAPLSVLAIAATLLVPPVVCAFGLLVWRLVFPDEAVRSARRKTQAAQEALVQLKYAGGRPWKVVERYLQERLEFFVDDPTPIDVADFLKRRGFTKEHCALALEFFQSCDAVRYTSGASRAQELHLDAARLVQALESDPCAR